jgi:heme/copper-type cytochrome/quinol oxidase subunit 2
MKVDDEEFYERVENSNGDLNLPTNIRLLSVDNCVMLPINNHIRILVTAADVLHS